MDEATRRKIVKQAARRLRLRLSRKLVRLIANQDELVDLGAIENFMVRLKVFSSGLRRAVTPELIAEALLSDEVLIERERAESDVPRVFSAIENGDALEVEALLRQGIDLEVTAQHQEGMTPLLLALFQRDAGIAELLLRAGANPHNRGDYSCAPIHVASLDLRCLALLLDAGAEANALDDRGSTPLMRLATHDRNVDKVSMLLAVGADPQKDNPKAQTARDIAAKHGATQILRMLEGTDRD